MTPEPPTAAPVHEKEEQSMHFQTATIVVLAIECVACLITIIVNPVTMKAILSYKLFKKMASNLFLLNLCLSDFFFGSSYLCIKVCHSMVLVNMQNNVARIVSWMAWMFGCIAYLAALTNVILIGLDRAIATAFPLKHRRLMTIKVGCVAVVGSWVCSLLLIVPPVIEEIKKYPEISDMHVALYSAHIIPPEYITKYIWPYLGWCFLMSVAVYSVVIVFYFKAKKRVTANANSSDLQGQRMTRMVVIIVCFFLVAHIPVSILGSFPAPDQNTLNALLMEIFQFLIILPTFVNNFVYALHIDYYKEAYMSLICCSKGKSVSGSPRPTTTGTVSKY